MSFKNQQQKIEKIFLFLIILSLVILSASTLFLIRFILKTVGDFSLREKPRESNLHFKLLEAEKILFQEH
ncbi:MAG: hypothetical protein ACPLXL_00440 [Minisyncoccia bacterium]